MKYKLRFDGPIKRWDEGLPLGNGKTGCLIWGKPDALRFSLDRTDIWDRTPPANIDAPEFNYAHLTALAKQKQTDEIRRIFDAPYQAAVPTKLPAGKILLHFEEGLAMQQTLDLQNAEAVIELNGGQGKTIIQALCHSTEATGMIKVEGAADCKVELQSPGFGTAKNGRQKSYDPKQRSISQGSLKTLCYPEAERGRVKAEKNIEIIWFTQEIDPEFTYGIVMAVQKLSRETQIFYRIITSADRENWLEAARNELTVQLLKGYRFYRQSHYCWWQEYWQKSKVSIPDKMIEKQWYLTNYLFASCSRKGSFPMPLQGVWTADDGCLPPWKGDYHNDLNTQLSYSHFYKANHLEEGEVFLDFLWQLRDAARGFAENFYQTGGICLPGVMTIDGKPLGGWPMYSLSPVHQIWLCRSFEQYYRYTGDEGFLRQRAWVYFEETAKCITSLLEQKADGKYCLPVSSSPELHDDEGEAWVTPNSNYDLALLRYFYQTLADFSRQLDNGQEDRWQQVLDGLPELAVDQRQVLMIAPDETLTESHRHLSNAMAISPLRLIGYEQVNDRAIVDAVILDYERLGSGMWVGFSFAWMAHLYAVAGNGQGAREQLRIFWESFCGPNGFHLNGDYQKRGYSSFHYRPFTLEANMFAADALQEMLFQMKAGIVDLFPAVPRQWLEQGVGFQNFCGEGGLKVTAWARGGEITQVTLTAHKEQRLKLRCTALCWEKEVVLKPGGNWRL